MGLFSEISKYSWTHVLSSNKDIELVDVIGDTTGALKVGMRIKDTQGNLKPGVITGVGGFSEGNTRVILLKTGKKLTKPFWILAGVTIPIILCLGISLLAEIGKNSDNATTTANNQVFATNTLVIIPTQTPAQISPTPTLAPTDKLAPTSIPTLAPSPTNKPAPTTIPTLAPTKVVLSDCASLKNTQVSLTDAQWKIFSGNLSGTIVKGWRVQVYAVKNPWLLDNQYSVTTFTSGSTCLVSFDTDQNTALSLNKNAWIIVSGVVNSISITPLTESLSIDVTEVQIGQ